MSGWIKIEKDLFNDPRVLRIAKKVFATEGNAGAFQVTQAQVTQVVGGLCKLWCIADTHCDSANTMDGDISDLNDLIGIPDFCQALPQAWLQDLGGGLVKLPEYQEHNGVEAKKRLCAAKRQTAFKKRHKEGPPNKSNAHALPDQDQDQDQDQYKEKNTACSKRKSSGTRGTRWETGREIPYDWITEAQGMAKGVVLDLDTIAATFTDWWPAQPGQKGVKVDWHATWRNWIRKEVREINGHRGNGRKATGVERVERREAQLEAGRVGGLQSHEDPFSDGRTIEGEILTGKAH